MSRSEQVPTSSVECLAVDACMALAAFVYLPLAFMARVVMVAILYTAFDVFRSAFETLSDKARIPEGEIRDVVEALDGVENAHCIRTRGTRGDVYVDLHVLVDPEMSVATSHMLTDRIEETITAHFPQAKDVLVHVEPDDDLHRVSYEKEKGNR